MRILTAAGVLSICACLLAAQEASKPPDAKASEPKPSFEAAHVQMSPNTRQQFGRFNPVRDGRYEIQTATIVDMIRTAYGFQNDKIIGGPNWLEMTRYDITAKVPAETSPDNLKLMLQSLLADRFGLKAHKDTKPLPTYALMAGKKPNLKEAAGSGETGCHPQAGAPPGPGGGGTIVFSTSANTAPVTIRLGPGGTVTYTCRNLTMTAFVSEMRSMFGANLGTNPILEETGLKGAWDFDIHYSMNMIGFLGSDQGDHISFADAVEKQLGLKLEKREVPTPVIVVDSVNEKPTPDGPDVAEALPPVVYPTEFDVASVKPSEPFTPGAPPRMMRFGMQPGGRFESNGLPLRFLIDRAFNSNNREAVQGVPDFAQTERYDITAKVNLPPSANMQDNELLAPLVRGLLVDRFKMKYHTEERPVTAYALSGSKPKMKKSDPASRTHCTQGNAPAGSPPGSRTLTCQNVTMAQFAEQLQGMTPDLPWPVEDATHLEGNWDLTLTFMANPQLASLAARASAVAGGGGGGDAATPQAADPSGGYTIFEAIEKQLGLKLEKVKRNESVVVIDHLEAKPTEN